MDIRKIMGYGTLFKHDVDESSGINIAVNYSLKESSKPFLYSTQLSRNVAVLSCPYFLNNHNKVLITVDLK